MRLNKKTIIMLVMCIGIFFMAVGYSILMTELKITGGANITSTWDVRITGITTTAINGSAYNLEEPSFTNDTAKFKVALVNPGDSIGYRVTIENKGTVTAVLNNIELETSGTEHILYTASGLFEGHTLTPGDTATFYVSADYNTVSNVVVDPLERAKSLKVSMEWVQYTNQFIPVKTYNVVYHANGGSGTMDTQECFVESVDWCYAYWNEFTRNGYEFLGWSTYPDGPVVYCDECAIVEGENAIGQNGTLNLYAVWGKVTDFSYTKTIQTFVAPVTGQYRLEVWGAQGGSATTTYRGGYGGYARGDIILEKGTTLYVVVGGRGVAGYPNPIKEGGYNGGGSVTITSSDTNRYVASGGGATHIATTSGLLKDLTSAKDSILIVAGGGGGGYAHITSTSYAGIGGNGGGNAGGDGAGGSGGAYGTGGTFTAAGYAYGDNTIGKGGFGLGGSVSVSNPHGSAGGGGYYGGGASKASTGSNGNSSGGGGSGYINNGRLSNKQMRCYTGCGTSTSAGSLTYAMNTAYESPTSYYPKINDGYARITQLSV